MGNALTFLEISFSLVYLFSQSHPVIFGSAIVSILQKGQWGIWKINSLLRVTQAIKHTSCPIGEQEFSPTVPSATGPVLVHSACCMPRENNQSPVQFYNPFRLHLYCWHQLHRSGMWKVTAPDWQTPLWQQKSWVLMQLLWLNSVFTSGICFRLWEGCEFTCAKDSFVSKSLPTRTGL